MSKTFEWIIENLDFVITVTIAIAVTTLVSLGYIPTTQIPTATLGVLLTLTLFLAVKNYRLGNKVNSIGRSLLGIEHRIGNLASARILSGTKEFFQTLNSVLSENSKLDVTYFSPMPPTFLPGSEVQKYWKTLSANLKKSPAFRVRRIATIETLKKLEWLKQTIAESKNSPQYHLAVLDTEQPFPLLNLVILDGRFVVIFGPHIQESDSHYIFVDNPSIATVANEYFEDLWRVATKLKVGHQIYDEVFTGIEQQLSSSSQA